MFFFDLYSDVLNHLLKSLVDNNQNILNYKKILIKCNFINCLFFNFVCRREANNNPKESKTNTVEEKKEVVAEKKTADCITIHLRWNEDVGDDEGGMILIYHRVNIEVCDDGSVTITGS